MENSCQSPHLETKALYNSFVMLCPEEPIPKEELWKKREWRVLSLEELFEELCSLGINFDKRQFYYWAAECDTPEELFDLVIGEEDEKTEKADHIYLLLFELWRRLAPEKRSLSIVADDIDHCIDEFDKGREVPDSEVEALLVEWGRLIDSVRDTGCSEEEAQGVLRPFFAHDVPDFVVDFLLELTGRLDTSFASQILEKVRSHCNEEPLWITFIELKLSLHDENVVDVRKTLGELVSAVLTESECDIELTLALCDIAFELQKDELLIRLLEKLIPHLEEQEDFLATVEFIRDLAERKGEASVVSQTKNLAQAFAKNDMSCVKELMALLKRLG